MPYSCGWTLLPKALPCPASRLPNRKWNGRSVCEREMNGCDSHKFTYWHAIDPTLILEERERKTEMEGGQSLSGPLATPNGNAICLIEWPACLSEQWRMRSVWNTVLNCFNLTWCHINETLVGTRFLKMHPTHVAIDQQLISNHRWKAITHIV